MEPKATQTWIELTADELDLISGGKSDEEVTVQGGGLPKPILSGRPPAPPPPTETNLP